MNTSAKQTGTDAPLPANFWAYPATTVMATLNTGASGITNDEALRRKKQYGANTIQKKQSYNGLVLFLNQFKSPITLILLAAAIIAFNLGDKTDGYVIFTIIFISSGLGFWQEKGASSAVAKLLALVKLTTRVVRNGTEGEKAIEEVVPGDIILLGAGDVVPADGLIVESKELFVDEAAFTGETFPAEKMQGVVDKTTVIAKRTNAVFMGSHVISGTAKIVVVNTGLATEFGAISSRLKATSPETDFEKGIKHFGYMLMQITLVLVVVILAVNLAMKKPVLDSFLFAMAIAVGLTPQLLPAIISINMAQGAKRMAKVKVIVKKLSAIENFGSMNMLCSDKTGTVTQGKVKVEGSYSAEGAENKKVLFYAGVNAYCQRAFKNPIDQAFCEVLTGDEKSYHSVDEIPYDFIRKRLSILASNGSEQVMICKGALKNILDICTQAQTADGQKVPLTTLQQTVEAKYQEYSAKGYRTLGVAIKAVEGNFIKKDDEKGMVFIGFITLFDPLKPGIQETVKTLQDLGIAFKMITGDNALVAKHVMESLGMQNPTVITGTDLRTMGDSALVHKALKANVFAEIEPNQKERIILALKKSGHSVGYMGDGINDATALHAADVGISVADAVDVAKEAADIVLLDNDLQVLINGVKEGRITFANTLKYIFMATSANFGNMFSMAGASIFLPFLPLLPKQILLTNLLTDFPEMTISSDRVDDEMISKPRKWDIVFIRKFMMVFGIISSVFDYATFGVLLLLLHAKEAEFQTGWFLESVVSATFIVLVVRSRKVFFKSRLGKYLLITTVIIIGFTFLLPLLPLAKVFNFVPLPPLFNLAVLLIVVSYVAVAEFAKKMFYKHYPGY